MAQEANPKATNLMRAALYARVSTHAGHSPEMQIAELREFCTRRDWEITGEYVDVGVSGAKERRPQLWSIAASAVWMLSCLLNFREQVRTRP